MKKIRLLDIMLNLFDGGAAAAGGDGAGAAASGQAGTGTQGDTKAGSGSTRRGNAGEYQNVLFGKQQATASAEADAGQQQSSDAGSDNSPSEGKTGVQVTSDTLEARQRAYQEFVNSPENKDIYAEDIQRIINRRFSETKTLQSQLSQQQPFIDMMMQRYNIADGDMAKLITAAENDNTYWAEAAEQAGMSVEQYKQLQKLQRENAALLRQQQLQRGQQQARQQLQKWGVEEAAVKEVYPDFDLKAELENPQFRYLISNTKSPVPLKLAYEVVHMEEIKAGVAKKQAETTEKQVVAGIRAKGARPQENGMAAQSGFTVKDDVTKISKKDRNEVARRVMRGEKITFG